MKTPKLFLYFLIFSPFLLIKSVNASSDTKQLEVNSSHRTSMQALYEIITYGCTPHPGCGEDPPENHTGKYSSSSITESTASTPEKDNEENDDESQ